MYHVFRGNYTAYVCQFHAKYGEIVRTGRDHISLSNTADTRHILSLYAFCSGPIYEKHTVLAPNSFLTTDPQLSKVWRRQIGDAFSAHIIRALESLVLDSGAKSLVLAWRQEIMNQGGTKAQVNYYNSFYRMSYDVIGALEFGESFGILATGNMHAIDMFQNMIRLKNVHSLTPFARNMQWMLGKLNRVIDELYSLSRDTVAQRKQQMNHMVHIEPALMAHR